MSHETWLNSVITVINGEPQKLAVKAVNLTDSIADPLNMTPAGYSFKHADESSSNKVDPLFLKIAKRVVSGWFATSPIDLHNVAVAYGLHYMRTKSRKIEFTLNSVEYEQFINRPRVEGKDLEMAVLRFLFEVNSALPSEPVTGYDLADNIHADSNNIDKWLGNHLESEFLITRRWKPGCQARGQVNRQRFFINPKKKEDLASYLSSHRKARKRFDSPLIFMSYANKDKMYAGRLKKGLVAQGFEVFLAHDDLNPSDDFIKEIRGSLKQCDVFVALLTANFMASPWTDQESGQAIAHEKQIISIMVDGNKPPGFLGPYHAISAKESDDPQRTIDQIVDAIRSRSKND